MANEPNKNERVDYERGTVPAGYRCSKCGAHGCKLWRQYQTFADYIKLLCRECGERDQGEAMEGPGDSIGWLVPAVPTEANDSYWGYTSVPQPGVEWWKRLPTAPARERKGPPMPANPTERDLECARELLRVYGLRGHSPYGAGVVPAIAQALAEARQEGARELATAIAADLKTLEPVLDAAKRAAWKLETMYARREASRRAELDGLIEQAGSHDIPGVWGHGRPRVDFERAFVRIYSAVMRAAQAGAQTGGDGDGA